MSGNKKHIFFVGIGGIGMSAIAKILMEQGNKISGSDQNPGSLTKFFKDQGATIYDSHQSTNITDDIDLLVYSSAIPEENPERQEALKRKIPEVKRAEILSMLMDNKYSIAVAGTHGKTTTSAMISYMAVSSGLDPTIAIGGKLNNLQTNAHLGKSKYFITEADEYDRSFLKLKPDIAVITNIETDHLDCYKNYSNIKNAFIEFTNHIKQNGILVCNNESANVAEILPEVSKKIITYSMDKNADIMADNISFLKNKCNFRVYHKNSTLGEIELCIPGRHNISNALATVAVATELGIPFSRIKKALSAFTGVERRFEIKGIIKNIMIIDDYAHHPTEIASTINGIRNGWRNRIIAIFQPHLYSRTRDFYKEFADSLAKADLVIITDIYAAREKPVEGITGEIIASYAAKTYQNKMNYIKDMETVSSFLLTILKPGDIVITMGAGDIWKVSDELVKKLNHLNGHSSLIEVVPQVNE
jgi:UDP-N-acetylmuramate--alanine ligase